MARNKGILTVSANFEPTIGQPFDSRQLVDYKSDLLNPATWTEGNRYLYNGLIVAVASDTEENCGIYRLKDRTQYTNYDAWEKLVDSSALKELAYKDLIDIVGSDLSIINDKIDLTDVNAEQTTFFGTITVDTKGRVIGFTKIDILDGNGEPSNNEVK